MKKVYFLILSMLFASLAIGQDYTVKISGKLVEDNYTKGDLSNYVVAVSSFRGYYAETRSLSDGSFSLTLYGKGLPDTLSLYAINKCGQKEYAEELYVESIDTSFNREIYITCTRDSVHTDFVYTQDWNNPQTFNFAAIIEGEYDKSGPLTYNWYLDGTNTMQDSSFSYTFPKADTCYYVSLEIQTANQDYYYVDKTVCTYSPVPSGVNSVVSVYSVNQPGDNHTFIFYAKYWAASGYAPIKAVWSFGDGNTQEVTSNFTNPVVHTYDNDGIYTVTVTFIFQYGTDATNTITSYGGTYAWATPVQWYPEHPQALFFSYPNPDNPLEYQFINVSTLGANSANLLGCSWDFGDGSPTTVLDNPSHVYDKPGTYNVTLKLFTTEGVSTFQQYTQVGQALNPIMFYPIISGKDSKAITVTLTNISTSDDDDEWEWDVGDALKSATKAETSVSFTVPEPGVYTFSLLGLKTLTQRTMMVDVIDVDSFNILSSTLSHVEAIALTPTYDISDNHKVAIYPVPAQRDLNLVISGDGAQSVKVTIFNTAGQKVYIKDLGQGNRFVINTGNLQKGIYFMKVEYDNKVSLLKFIK